MSAKASTAAADVPVRRKTSKKATYRADLLQEPDKDTHQHAAEANEFESQLMDVGKRLIAVSLMCGASCMHSKGGHTVALRPPPRRARMCFMPHHLPTGAGTKMRVSDRIASARREVLLVPWPRLSSRPWTAQRLFSRPTRA